MISADRTTNAYWATEANYGVGVSNPDKFGRSYDKIIGVSSATAQGAIEVDGATGGVIDLGYNGNRKFSISQASAATSFLTLTTDPLYLNVNGNFTSFLSNGNGGRGVVTPTALWHIKAGGSAAGTSPLKFTLTSANILTTPEAGVFEPDANGNLYMTNSSGVRYKIAMSAENSTTSALSAATLNTTYPNVLSGFKVICPSISGGPIIYTKYSAGWISMSGTIAP